MCNQEFSNLLSTLSSVYISNFSIMQQIACITMYFATIDEWTSYSGVLDLVKNLISYTHNFCNSFSINPNNKMTVSNRMYPLFSIFQNMSQNRCYMYLAWSIGRGMDILLQLRCIETMHTLSRWLEDDPGIADESCRILLRFSMNGLCWVGLWF